jgi:hypothetical protein
MQAIQRVTSSHADEMQLVRYEHNGEQLSRMAPSWAVELYNTFTELESGVEKLNLDEIPYRAELEKAMRM